MRKSLIILMLAFVALFMLGGGSMWLLGSAPEQAASPTAVDSGQQSAAGDLKRERRSPAPRPRAETKLEDDQAATASLAVDAGTPMARAYAGEITLAQAMQQRFRNEQLDEEQAGELAKLLGNMCTSGPAVPGQAQDSAASLHLYLTPGTFDYCEGFVRPDQSEHAPWNSPISAAPTPEQQALAEDAQTAADKDDKRGGINLILAELDGALYRADYPMVVAAIGELVRQGWLPAPIPEAPHSVQMYNTRLGVFAANVLLCERLGGCGPQHPLTIHVCMFEGRNGGCYQPMDVDHAIAQTETGLRYQVLQVLVRDLRRLLAGRGGFG